MRYIIFTLAFFITSSATYAQISNLLHINSGGMISIQWDISKASSPMNETVPNTSFNGFSIDFKHCYQHGVIVGARSGIDFFYQKKLLVIKEGADSTISIRHINNTINAVPIMLTFDYMLNSNKVIPYAGIGVGAYYILSKVTEENVTTQSNNSFHFGVSPEIGITIPSILSNFGFNFSTRYNYAFATSKAPSYSWFNFSLGFSFMY